MKPLNKQVQLFFTIGDEREFSEKLALIRPHVIFLDDNVWLGGRPEEAVTVDSCRSGFSFLWDRSIVPNLPTITLKDGRLQGPSSGVVIQMIRSRISGDTLLSGRLAAGTGGSMSQALEVAMRVFVADVWRLLGTVSVNNLDAVDPSTRSVLTSSIKEYRVGNRAMEWLIERPERILKDRSTLNFYLPSTRK